jgi:hypothetical protein
MKNSLKRTNESLVWNYFTFLIFFLMVEDFATWVVRQKSWFTGIWGAWMTVKNHNSRKLRVFLLKIQHWHFLPPSFWDNLRILLNQQEKCSSSCSDFLHILLTDDNSFAFEYHLERSSSLEMIFLTFFFHFSGPSLWSASATFS